MTNSTNMQKYTRDRLLQVFESVQPTGGWKKPINRTLRSVTRGHVDLVIYSVLFFAGTAATATWNVDGSVQITAPGCKD